MSDQGFTWFASYPKSGNTYLRSLLEAYRHNGALDINDMSVVIGDGGGNIMRSVSPIPLDDLGFRGEALVRPAALLMLYSLRVDPVLVKTHWCNIQPKGLPPSIPKEFTKRAVYIVRDPRDVFLSMCNYMTFPPKLCAEKMSDKDFRIGGSGMARALVSSWSNHVAGWTTEENFPVHILKYEDLCADPEGELKRVLEFIEWDVDEGRVKVAVEASNIAKLKKAEEEHGFRENLGKTSTFFGGGGGSRWKDELGSKWARRIEDDHGDIMRAMGYLEDNVRNIEDAVERASI